MFFLCSVYVLVYLLFMFDLSFLSMICVWPYFYVFLWFFMLVRTKKTQNNIKIRPYANNWHKKRKQNINQNINRTQKNINKFMLHLCFVYVLFVFCLCFACVFYVCQNPKILFSQNKILDFCLTQVLRKQSVCQTRVKHRANIVSHNSAHLQRRWKHVRDSWDTWLPEWFVDSFVFCWWVVLCFIVDSLAFCLWWVSDVFMIHLCLLLCCVYVVLCWFFTSLVYVRLLASDLVPIDEALWVYLTYDGRRSVVAPSCPCRHVVVMSSSCRRHAVSL